MSVVISSLKESLPSFLKQRQYSTIAILVDTKTKRYCLPFVKKLMRSNNRAKYTLITVPAGEHHKQISSCEHIWQALTDAQFDRYGLVINLGGGVIGDMGGFCAATYKRGVDFIQVPTTLLAQVDASVGGKLGINFHQFKNHIGIFRQPEAVLIDPVFLETLPERELRSGFAEVIKHCLIADPNQWDIIRRLDLLEQNWNELITHSVRIKKNIVAQDPTEKGIRKILNFGHTIGHALETFFMPDEPSTVQRSCLLHGEAIAAGMVMEAFISYRKKLIDKRLLGEIEEYLFSIYGRVELETMEVIPIIDLTQQDKKNHNGQVRMALLNGRGNCAYDVPVTPAEMRAALAYYQS